MPSLDIATAQSFLPNHLGVLKSQTIINGKALSSSYSFSSDKSFVSAWKSLKTSNKLGLNLGSRELRKGALVIKAVATFEPQCLVKKEDGHKGDNNLHLDTASASPAIRHQSTEVDDKEMLRRRRISKANKGNTPWNKGRKHSAETLQRIRERTRIAMQDPKVKMKLANLGHAQSKETRKKIGAGVRMGWQRRREKQMLQETCYFDWQNLIAEASRSGYSGEEELQWDSYKILDGQLEQEWLESVELRKTMTRPKGSKRAPKSPEQRRKIAEAIAAKWADPEYRDRVCTGLAKYHGVPVGTERRPRRKPSGTTQSTRRSSTKKKTSDENDSSTTDTTSQIQRSRLKRSNAPLYKDPLANSKLEMIKNIRAQRAAAETNKTEAIERARLLIAEAEKAAKALEVAAMKSPSAQASLLETRKLIAEAIRSIESAETAQFLSKENGRYLSVPLTQLVNQVEKETGTGTGGIREGKKKVNGHQSLVSNSAEEFGFDKSTLQEILMAEELLPTSSRKVDLPSPNMESLIKQTNGTKHRLEPNGSIKRHKSPVPNGVNVQSMKEAITSKSVKLTKKWICGRLVELTEES